MQHKHLNKKLVLTLLFSSQFVSYQKIAKMLRLHQHLTSYNILVITARSKGINNTGLRELVIPPLFMSGSGPLQKSVLHIVKQTTTFPLPGRNAHVVWLSETIVRSGKSVSENIFPSVHPLMKENGCPVPASLMFSIRQYFPQAFTQFLR